MKPTKFQPMALLGSFAICFAAAAIGAAATADAPVFYDSLLQPPWAPSSGLFGPVWTILYSLMAVAAWLAWRRRAFQSSPTLAFTFALQLVLNAFWSWLFFRWRHGLFALLDILALIVAVAALCTMFWCASRLASLLMWPYLLWISYAAALNFSLWRQNPSMLQ